MAPYTLNEVPLIIFACVLVIVVFALFAYGYRKRVKVLIPSLEIRTIRRAQVFRAVGGLACIALLLAALFVGASELAISEKTGVIAYGCDESRSMGAENEEGESRIERCKNIIQTLDSFPYSVVSVYGFTERAFSHSSFSTNHEHFKKTAAFLVAVEAVPGTGSEIGLSVQSVIEDTANKRDVLGKKAAIVVLGSDGESTSAEERENLIRAVQYAKNSSVKILAIGIGEDVPTRIPLYEGGILAGYEKDARGNEIFTKRDDATLRFLAEGSGGAYFSEQEIGKAVAFLAEALRTEKVEAEKASSKIVLSLLMAALVPFVIFLRHSII